MLIIVGNASARKMLENAAESHQSSARFVSPLFGCKFSVSSTCTFKIFLNNYGIQVIARDHPLKKKLKPDVSVIIPVSRFRKLS